MKRIIVCFFLLGKLYAGDVSDSDLMMLATVATKKKIRVTYM